MAESKRDYYEVLGVGRDADEATLKKAYRQIAKKYHPDMNPGDAEAEKKFKEASEAYAVLSDPDKRRQYDQFGHAAFEGGAGGAGGFGGFDFSGADFSDIFGDIFGDLFGGGRRGRANQGPMKGMNIRKSVRLTFEEAVFGCEKELDVVLKDPCPKCHGTGAKPGTSPETCPKCNGTGQVVYTQQSMFGMVRNVQTCPDCGGTGKIIREKCGDCRGTGYTSSRKKIQVSVPAGIDDGQSIRIREKGEPGTNGGPRGDLLVEVRVARHPIFQRQDMNIFSTAPITYAQAALGGTIRISTVDGDVEYEVKPGTQTDTKIRLKGKGVPSLRNRSVRGDHYVTLVVQVPTKLNEEAKEAREMVERAGLTISAMGSPFGKISITDDFEPHFEKFERALSLCGILGTNRMRIFSFYMPEGQDPAGYRDEVLRRMDRMLKAAEKAGVFCAHENEKGIYGDTDGRCLDLLQGKRHARTGKTLPEICRGAAWPGLLQYIRHCRKDRGKAQADREGPAENDSGPVVPPGTSG